MVAVSSQSPLSEVHLFVTLVQNVLHGLAEVVGVPFLVAYVNIDLHVEEALVAQTPLVPQTVVVDAEKNLLNE